MQQKTGFSDTEAEDALDLMVESLAERLTDEERENFASQLPPELQDIALGAHIADRHERNQDLINEFMKKEGIEEDRAKKQVLGAWETLKSLITEGQIRHLQSQLPGRVAAVLY
jgi:uncharacterized protein (DUF2267 family)